MKKTALVTGAGSGIGRYCTIALATAGYDVVLTGRTRTTLEETVSLASDTGATEAGNLSIVVCDVTDAASVDTLFATVESDHQTLDVVFNNAGTNVPASTIDELSVEDFKKVLDVNLTGAVMIARGAFALMRRQSPQGGRIINNGSISAHLPRPGSVAYTVSKHGITGLTRTLSLDGRPFNIACGQIDIGNAASAMTAKMSAGVPQADGSMKPEPTMDTQHVADAVVNMANLPLSANVQFMTIMATNMPFVGRG